MLSINLSLSLSFQPDRFPCLCVVGDWPIWKLELSHPPFRSNQTILLVFFCELILPFLILACNNIWFVVRQEESGLQSKWMMQDLSLSPDSLTASFQQKQTSCSSFSAVFTGIFLMDLFAMSVSVRQVVRKKESDWQKWMKDRQISWSRSTHSEQTSSVVYG